MRGDVTDVGRRRQPKIELPSQWKLEAESGAMQCHAMWVQLDAMWEHGEKALKVSMMRPMVARRVFVECIKEEGGSQ